MSKEPGQSGAVGVDGAILRYACEGFGLPALVIGSAVYYPRTFSRRLREKFRLVFMDARHFAEGDDSFELDNITLNTYLTDIERVHTHLELGRVVLIGHSHHGNLALEYAKQYPERVSHVVLVGSPPLDVRSTVRAGQAYWENRASETRKEMHRERLAAFHSREEIWLTPEQAYVGQYVAEGPKYWCDSAYDASHLWQGVPLNMNVLKRFRDFFAEGYALHWDPERLTAPVLMMMGQHDYAVPHVLWDSVQAVLPKFTFHLFERSGHTPQLEEPEQFDRVLLEWVG